MNNDRFKFRLWYEKQGYIDNSAFAVFGDGKIFLAGAAIPSDNDIDLTLEQCTGLRDKNGNLIYENDVVQLRAEDNTFVSAVVVWQNGCFCPGDDEPFGDSTMWEIIGNVHEQK